jgi:predicted alpha/beta-hydrolase family hydrolase
MALEVVEVTTGLGVARAYLHPGHGAARRAGSAGTTTVLGHGAGGGVDARDLVGLATALPTTGVSVVLVEQPWRVAGRSVAGRPAGLDQAWREVLADPWLRAATGLDAGNRLVCGGRSAGARVACRTAGDVGADAVVALAFPLHPPGRAGDPARSRAGELAAVACPLLVVQGGRDAFGTAQDLSDPGHVRLPDGARVAAVPHADHGFAVPARLHLPATYAVDLVVAEVAAFLAALA